MRPRKVDFESYTAFALESHDADHLVLGHVTLIGKQREHSETVQTAYPRRLRPVLPPPHRFQSPNTFTMTVVESVKNAVGLGETSGTIARFN
jgi:hypothetical protein